MVYFRGLENSLYYFALASILLFFLSMHLFPFKKQTDKKPSRFLSPSSFFLIPKSQAQSDSTPASRFRQGKHSDGSASWHLPALGTPGEQEGPSGSGTP